MEKKKLLKKAIREKCMVEIETSDRVKGFMDIDLYIEFLDGTLKGMEYKINIDLKNYHEVE